jgi:glutathione S-transferase
MITVFGFPNSRSLRVTWMLEELGLPYDYRKVDLFKGEGQLPNYLAINPNGKVPAIVDGDLVLYESGAICTWLGERHPDAGLLPRPDEAMARAACLQWLFFILTELDQPLWNKAKHRFALPRERRVPEAIPTFEWEFYQALRVLDAHLAEREFMVADRFTVADIFATHVLVWALSARMELKSAALDAYVARMETRPALARARERERADNPG